MSGNLTLMSAGYFLSPEGQTIKEHQILQMKKTKTVHFQQRGFRRPTLVRRQGDERDELGEDAPSDDGAGNKAGVVSGILSFHLGDVQVPRLLGDEAAAVRVQEKREFVVDPAVGHLLCNTGRQRLQKLFVTPEHQCDILKADVCTYLARILAQNTVKRRPGPL